jgi:hypothetical protein
MNLIYTNDGLIGLDFDPQCDVIWCNDLQEAARIAHANFQKHISYPEMWHELNLATKEITKNWSPHQAHFGHFGRFMYLVPEQPDAK